MRIVSQAPLQPAQRAPGTGNAASRRRLAPTPVTQAKRDEAFASKADPQTASPQPRRKLVPTPVAPALGPNISFSAALSGTYSCASLSGPAGSSGAVPQLVGGRSAHARGSWSSITAMGSHADQAVQKHAIKDTSKGALSGSSWPACKSPAEAHVVSSAVTAASPAEPNKAMLHPTESSVEPSSGVEPWTPLDARGSRRWFGQQDGRGSKTAQATDESPCSRPSTPAIVGSKGSASEVSTGAGCPSESLQCSGDISSVDIMGAGAGRPPATPGTAASVTSRLAVEPHAEQGTPRASAAQSGRTGSLDTERPSGVESTKPDGLPRGDTHLGPARGERGQLADTGLLPAAQSPGDTPERMPEKCRRAAALHAALLSRAAPTCHVARELELLLHLLALPAEAAVEQGGPPPGGAERLLPPGEAACAYACAVLNSTGMLHSQSSM